MKLSDVIYRGEQDTTCLNCHHKVCNGDSVVFVSREPGDRVSSGYCHLTCVYYLEKWNRAGS